MHPLVKLSKTTIETYLDKKQVICPDDILDIKDYLEKQAGVFVTLLKNHQLRGCIGTYLPTQKNIAQETVINSLSAAFKDFRFGPVLKEELDSLSYAVYVLDKPEPTKFNNLDPLKYGIIVRSDFKSSLLLPELENINTPKDQFLVACQKAGINPQTEQVHIYRFKTHKYQ